MEENNEIKIVKLGEQRGCMFGDKIQIELSPDWLADIAYIFEEKAMHNKSYSGQGFDRQKYDFFNKAYYMWREARTKKNNNEKANKKIKLTIKKEKVCKVYNRKIIRETSMLEANYETSIYHYEYR